MNAEQKPDINWIAASEWTRLHFVTQYLIGGNAPIMNSNVSHKQLLAAPHLETFPNTKII